MVTCTDPEKSDGILRRDMPFVLDKIETAANCLQEASSLSKIDPYSKQGRVKLIEGSKLILHGTAGVLSVFDDFEASD